MIGKFDQESKVNWIYKQGLVDSSNWDVYVTAIYFTFTTIITVGYGDILGVSNLERFFCMGLMFLGGFMYSLLTGLLSSIVQSEDNEEKMLNHQLAILRDMKSEFKIDKTLYKQLKSHFQFNYNKNTEDYKDIMKKLPNSTRVQLKQQMFRQKFLEIKFLQKFFNHEDHHNFIAWITPLFKTQHHPEMNIIYRERDTASHGKK